MDENLKRSATEEACTIDAKRPKPSDVMSPLNAALFTDSERARLQSEFASAQPYTHVVIRDLCQPATLIAAREELIHNVEAKFKETDLFKVYQTGDLANMDGLEPELAAKLPTLLAIRNAIYSKEFRNYVEQITGLEPNELRDSADCSCNVYAHGGHLLSHDDVISTRAVSYIIYLTDPEDEWRAEDGGALELYPLVAGDQSNPDVVPTTNLLPYFNSMAMFTVQPGRSFHAVQEVYTDTKPRLSISGWYHRATPPPGAEQASLNQLKSTIGQAPFVPLSDSVDDEAYTPVEKALLDRWINPTYLERKNMRSMVARWEAESCVQLQSFLRSDRADEILAALREADTAAALGQGQVPKYTAGVGGGWTATGPVHKQRYLRYSAPSGDESAANGDESAAASPSAVGQLLSAVHEELFTSSAFAKWLLRITDLTVQEAKVDIRRFRAGLDYTVAHQGGVVTTPILDATLCFVDATGADASLVWESDEVGGFQCYILGDEETNDAADTYKGDAEEEDSLITCSAAPNTLNILLRDSSLLKFVKYVSHDAPSSRFDIAVEFQTDLGDGEEGDSDGDGEAAPKAT